MDQQGPDPLDVKILRFLMNDARIPFSHIARNLNISDVAVKKRVEKLIQRGIIRGFVVDLDLKKVGYPYVVFIEIKPDPPLANAVFEKVLSIPTVVEAHMLVGEYPILVKAVAPDVAAIRSLVDQISKLDGVLELKTAVSLDHRMKPLDISSKIAQRPLGARTQ